MKRLIAVLLLICLLLFTVPIRAGESQSENLLGLETDLDAMPVTPEDFEVSKDLADVKET